MDASWLPELALLGLFGGFIAFGVQGVYDFVRTPDRWARWRETWTVGYWFGAALCLVTGAWCMGVMIGQLLQA